MENNECGVIGVSHPSDLECNIPEDYSAIEHLVRGEGVLSKLLLAERGLDLQALKGSHFLARRSVGNLIGRPPKEKVAFLMDSGHLYWSTCEARDKDDISGEMVGLCLCKDSVCMHTSMTDLPQSRSPHYFLLRCGRPWGDTPMVTYMVSVKNKMYQDAFNYLDRMGISRADPHEGLWKYAQDRHPYDRVNHFVGRMLAMAQDPSLFVGK